MTSNQQEQLVLKLKKALNKLVFIISSQWTKKHSYYV